MAISIERRHKTYLFKICISLFLFLFITEFTVYEVPQILTAFILLAAFYSITVRLSTTIDIIINNEILLIIIIILIYSLFILKAYLYGEIRLYQFVARVAAPAVVLNLTFIFSGNSIRNAIYLTRFLAVVLMSSCFFLVIGVLFFPHTFLTIKYYLYGSYYDLLTHPVNTQLIISGLAKTAYIFGFQIAAGFTLFLCLIIIERGFFRSFCCVGAIIAGLALIINAQRSTIPAVLAGFLVFIVVSNLNNKSYTQIFREKSMVSLVIIILLLPFLFVTYPNIRQYFSDLSSALGPVQSVFQRIEDIEATDLYIRFKLQAGAIAIALDNPFGLFVKGLQEEDWALLAMSKGYPVIIDGFSYDYALVHNAYLRILLYFGWLPMILIFYVFFRSIKIIKYISDKRNLEIIRKYGTAIGASFIALSVQSFFHNDSLFTTEKITWAIFILLLIWFRLAKIPTT